MRQTFMWLLLLGGASVASAAVAPAEPFEGYLQAFGKRYAPEEVEYRRQIFTDSLAAIDAINREQSMWRAGVNQFADLTWEEFQQRVLMAPQDCSATHEGTYTSTNHFRPHTVDWEKKGVLTPVKNQGKCGSCWTFSTTGTLEAHHFMKTGQRVTLSEQQLVDCAGDYDNHGCSGGLPSHAFEYIKYNGGLDSEDSYPYKGVDGNCSFSPKGVAAKVRRVFNISYLDEAAIEDAVAFVGPVSIAFEVSDDFRFYKSGIYNGKCSTDRQSVNHAVVAVGYGKDGKTKYWKVRNSWGPAWGEAGHFRILRGANKCGLADCASFPLV